MLLMFATQNYLSAAPYYCFPLGDNPMVPDSHAEAVIDHVCMVHASVGDYSKKFLQELRRSNYVTPKNYLDFINTYSNLLEDKDKYILGETFALSKNCNRQQEMMCDNIWH